MTPQAPSKIVISIAALLAGCGPGTLEVSDGPGDSTPWVSPGDTSQEAASDSAADSAASDVDPLSAGRTCGLVSDLDEPWFREGDEVSLRIACGGELPTEDAIFSPLALPEGARFDVAERLLTWETGPADGGRWDLLFSIRDAEVMDAVPAGESVTVWVADDPTLPDAIPVDPMTYTEEWGLPVVHVAPRGPLSQSEVGAEIVFEGEAYEGTIKIRGASSASYPKPGYTMEFGDVEAPILDWGDKGHLILISPFDDNSYVRQKLTYDLWAEICERADEPRLVPRTFFAVLYFDGAYQGLYTAIDRIDDEFVRQMGFDSSGGLYKAVNHDANFYLTNSSGGTKSTLHDGYEKKEGEPENDFSELDALVSFTGNSDARALIDGADGLLSVEEFMDWFLLVHYTLAEDSAGKNSYLYKDPESGRFFFAPWDFNHAWGQNWYTLRLGADDLNMHTSTNRVFWAIQQVEWDALWARFDELRADGPFDPAWQAEAVDGYYAQIQPSAERDWAKWEANYRSYGGWASSRNYYGDWTDYEGEKAYLYRWIEDRAAVFEDDHPPAR